MLYPLFNVLNIFSSTLELVSVVQTLEFLKLLFFLCFCFLSGSTEGFDKLAIVI